MGWKIGCIALITFLGALLSSPVGAQLAEAGRVAWPGFLVLKGHWQAIDGGERLDIHQVNPIGQIEARCSKPEPIHISRAQAARDGQMTKVRIGLREPDAFWTYDLTYDPGTDRLLGFTYQNTKNAQVVFVRVR